MTQEKALNILKTGANVFLTGEPGAGKTYTVNAYVEYLREHGIEPAITASTGIAATHLHGQTIHSWAGIGVRRTLTSYDLDTIATTEYLAKRISRTSILIIDEISMIDAQTLTMVEAVCRAVKQLQEPFGGIQVVLVGDFFQLPPVTNGRDQARFAFESPAWSAMRPLVCYLSEQHRQDDEAYLSVLAAIRRNEYGEVQHEHIEARFVSVEAAHAKHHSLPRLFSHNADVDTLNDRELEKIDSESRTFFMQSKGKDSLVAALKKGCLSPEVLVLKKGAIVMCTKNSREKGYVNGTLATVTDFDPRTRYPIITTRSGKVITIEPTDWNIEENGKIKASITQLPLRLAWAITIHKSQGMSLDAAVMDLSQVFEYGQGYVALSRVRSLSGLFILGVNPKTFEVHPRILQVDESFIRSSAAAEDSFADIAPDDLVKMHRNFLIAIGGDITATKGGKKKKEKRSTVDTTLDMVLEGKSITAIAKERNVTVGTIIGHLEKLAENGRLTEDQAQRLMSAKLIDAFPSIAVAYKKFGTALLGPVFAHFKGKYSFDELKLARVLYVAQKRG